jgi:hypothetical protein
MPQLLFAQRRLQFISDFYECHSAIIPAAVGFGEFGCNRKSSNIAA